MASRTRNFLRGLGAGYVAIAVNIAYTATSIPLALHYLGKEQFGLWALAQQIAGYLMLLDMGVSSAVSRFIADRKDEVNSGSYGSLLLTGAIVFASQGFLIALVGAVFSFFAPSLFSIPPHLSADFTNCLIIITSIAGLSVFSRSLGAPLWAFQRVDVSYWLGSLSLFLSFIALWFGFQQGWGIYSLAFAGAPGVILSPLVTFWFCRRNHYYPSTGFWGRPNWAYLHQIFLFGQDVLWMTLGSQMVNASQIMILSRVAGLSTASTFAVGTKLLTMAQQFTGRIIESSAPGLTEMFVRGDTTRFNLRFSNIFSITGFLSTLGAIALVAVNTPFVSFWTSGAVHWNLACDTLLAGLLIATSLTRCLISAFGLAGNLRPIRHIYFIEGCVFIALAIPAAAYFGATGLLFVSLVTHLGITGVLSLRASASILKSIKPLVLSGFASFFITLAVLLLSLWITTFTAHPITIFFIAQLIVSLAAMGGWLFILTPSLRKEIAGKFFRIIQICRRLLLR